MNTMTDECIFDCRGVKSGEVVLFYENGKKVIMSQHDYAKRLKQEDKKDGRR